MIEEWKQEEEHKSWLIQVTKLTILKKKICRLIYKFFMNVAICKVDPWYSAQSTGIVG